MFLNKAKQQRKRKAPKWQATHCFHGNKSITTATQDLTFDSNMITPKKRFRHSQPGGSSVPSPNINERNNNQDSKIDTKCSNFDESDKENMPFVSFGLANDLRMSEEDWESTTHGQSNMSYLLSQSEVSSLHRQSSVQSLTVSGQLGNTGHYNSSNDHAGLDVGFLNHESLENPDQAKSSVLMMEQSGFSTRSADSTHSGETKMSESDILRLCDGARSRVPVSPASPVFSSPDPRRPLSYGLLKIRIEVTPSRQLILYVEEASCLGYSNMDMELSYVQAALCPDKTKKSVCRSATTKQIQNPRFDQKFTYDLSTGDESKKLVVSVMKKHNETGSDKMVGCMSFGIKHLMSKRKKTDVPVEGWYHLLSDYHGNRKHLACNQADMVARQQKQTLNQQSNAYEVIKDTSKLEKKLHGTKKHIITVPKVSSGYGFTIKGSMPVRVGRVKPDGAAESVGLISGDYILSINDHDTISRSVESVANIVRNATKELRVCIARPSRSRSSKSATSCLQPNISTSEVPQSKWQPGLDAIHEEKTSSASPKLLRDITNRTRMLTPPRELWQPDLSVIDCKTQEEPRVPYDGEGIYEEIRDQDVETLLNAPRGRWATKPIAPKHIAGSQRNVVHGGKSAPNNTYNSEISKSYFTELETTMYDTHMSKSSWRSAVAEESRFYQSYSSGSESDVSSGHRNRTTDDQLPCPVGRQVAIHQLLTCEEDFTRMMKRGAQRFSRPLRHQLLSSSQHATLFQNIEKLVALSEFHIRQMINKSYCAEDSYMSTSDDNITDLVGQIYKAKMVMACEAYQMYYRGLDESLQLLDNLTQEPNFQNFLKRSEKARGYELSLSEFLQQPLAHFQQLVGCLGRVLLTTPQQHSDYSHIKRVMEDIHRCVARPDDVTAGNHGKNFDDTSSCLSTSTSRSYCNKLRKSCQSQKSSSSISSVDSEVVELQQKLNFSSQVKPFQLAVPSRHVILSGDLMYVSDSSVTTRQVVLCSDLLLLTQKESKGQLKVVEEPILLQQIVQADFDCANADEFRILYQKKESRTTKSGKSYESTVRQCKFRTTNLEQKWAWKTVLGQRITSVKSRADSAYVSMEEFV